MNNVCIIVDKLINGNDNIQYEETQRCTYSSNWLTTRMLNNVHTRRCPNVNDVLVPSLTGQWSPVVREGP